MFPFASGVALEGAANVVQSSHTAESSVTSTCVVVVLSAVGLLWPVYSCIDRVGAAVCVCAHARACVCACVLVTLFLLLFLHFSMYFPIYPRFVFCGVFCLFVLCVYVFLLSVPAIGCRFCLCRGCSRVWPACKLYIDCVTRFMYSHWFFWINSLDSWLDMSHCTCPPLI